MSVLGKFVIRYSKVRSSLIIQWYEVTIMRGSQNSDFEKRGANSEPANGE